MKKKKVIQQRKRKMTVEAYAKCDTPTWCYIECNAPENNYVTQIEVVLGRRAS